MNTPRPISERTTNRQILTTVSKYLARVGTETIANSIKTIYLTGKLKHIIVFSGISVNIEDLAGPYSLTKQSGWIYNTAKEKRRLK